MSLNAKMSEKLVSSMRALIEESTMEAVRWCGEHYNFDAEEALRSLYVNIELTSKSKSSSKPLTKSSMKARFVLPYHGTINEECCSGLRKNGGLYTQCQVQKKVNDKFCKTCQKSADKNDGIPEYGTIEEREAVDIFDYVDRKGRKPTSYSKIMKKLNLSEEDVLAEAERLNIIIDARHFEEQEEEVKEGKRGRPKLEKVAKEPKGAKGRPKKTKKVVEVNDDNEVEDLFASLVANANPEVEDLLANAVADAFGSLVANTETEEDETEEGKKIATEKEKKLALRLKEKEEKEALRLKEKEEKQALRLKEKEEKEALRLKQKEEKEAKKKADEEAKAQRLKEKEAAKEKKTKSKKVKEPEQDALEDDEPDIVKKIEVDGIKYLKSKKTGLIYNYNQYTQYGVQVVLGEWNIDKKCIDFDASTKYHEEGDEEEEEDEEQEDEEQEEQEDEEQDEE
jgi:hypothetical protein